MKSQYLKISTIILACILILNTTQAQLPNYLQTKLQDTLAHIGNRFNFKGLSVAVSFKNMGDWKAAHGQSSATQPLSTDMLIGIGSNTKTFVSAMLIKLHENGQLDLDDSIGQWIQGYNNISGAVTIRQLLNHTSGIHSYTEQNNFWSAVNGNLSKVWTKQEILSNYVSTPYFAAGTSFEYSNSNHLLAALIAEDITGRPLHNLIRDSILIPNSLQHTFFPPYETVSDPYTNFWTNLDGIDAWDDMGNWGQTGAVIPKEIQSAANAAGALVSTAEDNVMFWKALMNGQIITKHSLNNEMLVWQNGGSYGPYGLSVMRKSFLGNTIFSHGGTWIGQICSNLADTSNQIYISVLSNQDSLQNAYTTLVVNALYKVCLDFNKTVHVREYVKDNMIQFYPNPATDVLNVHAMGDQQITEAILYNQTGKAVLHKTNLGGVSKNQLDISTLKQGVYFLRVLRQDGTIINNKIIKK